VLVETQAPAIFCSMPMPSGIAIEHSTGSPP
jgi:hypothetical protein